MGSTAAGVAITPDGAETGSALGVERHGMRRIREVPRLKYENGLSHRSVSASTGMSNGSVSDSRRRADEAGLTRELARELDDATLKLGKNLGERLLQVFRDGRPFDDPAQLAAEVPVPAPVFRCGAASARAGCAADGSSSVRGLA